MKNKNKRIMKNIEKKTDKKKKKRHEFMVRTKLIKIHIAGTTCIHSSGGFLFINVEVSREKVHYNIKKHRRRKNLPGRRF